MAAHTNQKQNLTMSTDSAEDFADAPGRVALDRTAWIDYATQVLGDEGVEGLRIEVLARSLKVTKGSFYWHFKDRQALLNAVVTAWRDARIAELEAQVAVPAEAAALQIRRVIDHYATQPSRQRMRVELALRDWARRDSFVSTAVETVDRARLANAVRIFRLAGFPEEEARSRSLLMFTHLFGLSMMMFEENISQQIIDHHAEITSLIVEPAKR